MGFVADPEPQESSGRFVPDERRKPASTESPTSAKNLMGAAVEPLLTMGSGAVLGPVSGLAGLAAAGTNALGLTNLQPADVVRAVSNAGYAPKTVGGQNAMSAIGYIPEKIAQGADYLGGRTAEITGSPAVGAGLNAALQVGPQLLLSRAMSRAAPITGNAATASPEVQMLANKGVTMTPGQIKGGFLNTAEQAAGSIPFAGDAIKAARSKAIEQFNTATINDALAPVGSSVPKGLTMPEALQFTRKTLGAAYENLLPKMGGDLDIAVGQSTLRQSLDNIKTMGNNLPAQQKMDLHRIINDEVIGKFTQQGKASGQTLKDIQETLRTEINDYRTGGPYERKVANALQEVDSSLRDMVEAVNPQYASELNAINTGYAKFKIAQRAAKGAGAQEREFFTPSQYQGAVKGADKTKDKRAYTEAEANQQELANAASRVLPQKLADSGTPYRLATMEALMGGGAFLHPGVAAAGLAAPAIYSQPVLRGLQPFITGESSLGNAALRVGPYGVLDWANQQR